ncbi:MAG: undecaprenyldiphospho-muramoylpentapeptide beta-N-acetylglucosaminyltransferase [Christensenellaceae bacterium]
MGKVIVLTGGGSAGHVTPNLALVPLLQKEGYDVHYIGTFDGIEKSLVTDIPYHAIVAGKLRRYASAKNISDVFKILKGYQQSKKILKELRPSLVFAKGGFVSVPVVWAAAKLKIPVVLHESDYTPGLANKLCTKKANAICLSFDTPHAHEGKGILTGSPIRTDILHGDKSSGRKKLGFSTVKPVLLIMGGSLGAQALNEAVDKNIDALTQKYSIVHLRGKDKLNLAFEDLADYRQYEYVDKDLADIFAATDLVLSRSGANAVFEFLALRIPSLLVPLPLSASRGDQILNAQYFEKRGYAHVLEQEKLEGLLAALDHLYAHKQELIQNMQSATDTNGTQNVLNIINKNVGN